MNNVKSSTWMSIRYRQTTDKQTDGRLMSAKNGTWKWYLDQNML